MNTKVIILAEANKKIFQLKNFINLLIFIPFMCFSQQFDGNTKRFYESNSQLNVRDIKITKDNGFVVVGNAQIQFGQQTYTSSFIFFNDSSSNISNNSHWEKVYTTFGDLEDFSFEVVEILPDSSFIIAGKIFNLMSNNYGGALLRMDKFGNEIWKKSLENGTNEPINISDIEIESDSTMLILGSKMGQIDQSYLCRIDISGNLLWQRSFSLQGNDILELLAFEKLQNGSIILSGKSYANEFTTQGVLIMLDSTENLVWSIRDNQLNSSYCDVISDQTTIYCRNLDSNGDIVNSVSAYDLAGNNLWNYLIGGSEMNIPNSRRQIHFDLDSNLVVYFSNFSYGNFHRLTRQGNYIEEFAALGVAQGIEIDREDGHVLILSSGPSFGLKSSIVMNNHFAVTKLDNIQTSQSNCLWNYTSNPSQNQTTFTSVNLLTGDSCHLANAMIENVTAFINIDNQCVEYISGLIQNTDFDFEIIPNPASVYLDIILDPSIKIEDSTGSILDIYGKQVLCFDLNTFENHINISKIPSGNYWIKIGGRIKRINIL